MARIAVPTTLIWGRHDRANRPRIAEAASARYGWPLHVVENCADDPARDQPEAFLGALHAALDSPEATRRSPRTGQEVSAAGAPGAPRRAVTDRAGQGSLR